MMPELGTLCLAAGLALLLSVYPLWGAARQDRRLMAWRGRWPVGYSPVSAAPSCWCTPLWSMTLPSATWRKTPTARCRCGIG